MTASDNDEYLDKVGEPMAAGDLVQLRTDSATEMFSIQEFDNILAVYPAGTAAGPDQPGVVLTPEIAAQLLIVEHEAELA